MISQYFTESIPSSAPNSTRQPVTQRDVLHLPLANRVDFFYHGVLDAKRAFHRSAITGQMRAQEVVVARQETANFSPRMASATRGRDSESETATETKSASATL